jgi:hypothetical protein
MSTGWYILLKASRSVLSTVVFDEETAKGARAMKASIGAKTDLTDLTGEHENPKKSDGRFLWRHICGARKPIK